MLVLSRRPGEKVIVNDDLIITCLSVHVRTGKARFGFEGNLEKYKIVRDELIAKRLKTPPHG